MTGSGSLHRRAMTLGVANGADYAVQFLLPVVLTRTLDPDAFGHYRLLWLAVATIMAVAPLAMPVSLYYFLPRADAAAKRLYINQTLVYLGLAGLVAAWAVSAWNPLLPDTLRPVAAYGPVVPAFILLWVVASLLDLLPTAEEQVRWQANAIVGLSTVRGVALALAAWLTRDLGVVLYALLGFVVFKLALLLYYVARRHGLRGPVAQRAAFLGQVRHAAPFGISGALYGLRAQADQWVAASLFAPALFAAFSVASVLAPLIHVFRQSFNHAFLPSMSRFQAEGDITGMLELNSRANVAVALMVCPLLAFCFVYADRVVTLVYTSTYAAAGDVMRVYIVGMIALVVELNSIMLLQNEGRYAVRVNLAALAASVPISYFGATHFGLPGAAAGSVLAVYLERFATLKRISGVTGKPLRHVQDWRSLGLILAAVVVAGGVAWGLTEHVIRTTALTTQLGIGAAAGAVTYALMLLALGFGRAIPGFFAVISRRER
jgi:O-antigen/teichoic acid export membrane protein